MPRPTTLSYALNKKTDKLLKAYRKKSKGTAIMIPTGAIAGLLWVYFLGNMERYLDTWASVFTGDKNLTAILSPVEMIYFNVLFIASVFFGCVYALWSKYNEKYKKYKKEGLEILEIDPCDHRSPCSCKDEYCEWIEQEEGVDLL